MNFTGCPARADEASDEGDPAHPCHSLPGEEHADIRQGVAVEFMNPLFGVFALILVSFWFLDRVMDVFQAVIKTIYLQAKLCIGI